MILVFKMRINLHHILILIILLLTFNGNLFSEIKTKEVTVTSKIKLDYPILAYTDRFPPTFFITKDESILINYQEKDGENYMLLFNIKGIIQKKINLMRFIKILPNLKEPHSQHNLYYEGSVFDQFILDSNILFLTGAGKFYYLDLLKDKIIFEGPGGFHMQTSNNLENIFFQNQLRINDKFCNTILKYNCKTLTIDTLLNIKDCGDFFSIYNNLLYYGFDNDSLKIVSILNNSKIEKHKLFKYKSDKNYEQRVLGVNDKNIYINYLDYPSTDDNAIYYDSCKHYIHIYDRETVTLKKTIQIDFNEKIHHNFRRFDYVVDYPRGLIYHYCRYNNRIYVLFFKDDGAYLDYIDLNDE